MRLIASLLALSLLSGCATATQTITELIEPEAPTSAEAALQPYYDTIPDSVLPRASQGAPLPASDAVLTRILVGSCNDEENDSPVMQTLAGQEADLFLMIGDNVYGDRDGRNYTNNQVELTELRESFTELGADPAFQAVRDAFPMMVAWDDHDYGANDGGREFPFRAFAERIHERFWRLDDQDVGQWPGTYYARSFGPEGQRTQIIMLDTRYFRSSLTETDEYGATGKERYMPAPDGSMQDMLGATQWTWLENQLAKPADVRLIVSSIQVLTSDGHGWEHWANLPAERARLMELIASSEANGVVLVSGDRHTAFLYRADGLIDYPLYELTTSSMNVSFASESSERDSSQLGAGFAPANFGAVEIDWESGEIGLQILDENGLAVRQTRFPIPQ